MSEELTPRQQILLWDLVSRGGSAMQKDLRPEITPADREPLKRAGYISVSEKRPFQLTVVEEKCWSYLGAMPPTLLKAGTGSKYDRQILQFILERVSHFAGVNGRGLSEIFAGKRIVDDGETQDDRRVPVDREYAIQRQIEEAFSSIAGRPAISQVRLRTLRGHLPHIPRDDLDRALREMRDASRASFSTLSNPTDIEAEGDAALTIREQTFHTIWIEA